MPKFDVKEVKDVYELYGELPRINQKGFEIELTDASTLTIKRRTERSYTQGVPPAGFIVGEAVKHAHSENYGGGSKAVATHLATVEDKSNEKTQVTTSTPLAKVIKICGPAEKLWVSERSIGQFSRSFSFPALVDQGAVKANMRNSILSVLVPKAKKSEGRKIIVS